MSVRRPWKSGQIVLVNCRDIDLATFDGEEWRKLHPCQNQTRAEVRLQWPSLHPALGQWENRARGQGFYNLNQHQRVPTVGFSCRKPQEGETNLHSHDGGQ